MLMFLFFFALWLLFNGRLGWDVVGFGLVFGAVTTLFAVKICGWSSQRSRRLLRLAPALLAYAGQLLLEIVKANLDTLKVILSPGCAKLHPQIFRFDSRLRRGYLQTILANSITITPGTYTVGIDGTVLTVHALNGDFAEGTPGSGLNLQLIALEEKCGSPEKSSAEEGKK